jgi:hypothetical protein
MTDIAKAIATVGLCATGLTGLYFHVDYAGFVLFLGILVAL